jgi:pimeloyl-ACP methyl ester carboxylesterase
VPTLVLVGSHDFLTSPLAARDLAALVPTAQYEEIEGASHGLIWEQSDHVAELLSRFLSNA